MPTTSVLSALTALITEETADLGLILQAVDKHLWGFGAHDARVSYLQHRTATRMELLIY